jgi:hypothetical protein
LKKAATSPSGFPFIPVHVPRHSDHVPRHSREGGNPATTPQQNSQLNASIDATPHRPQSCFFQAGCWMPAFAGMTASLNRISNASQLPSIPLILIPVPRHSRRHELISVSAPAIARY